MDIIDNHRKMGYSEFMEVKDKKKSFDAGGYFLGSMSYIMWGILPFFWKSLKHVPPFQLLLNRIIWCYVFLFILSFFRKKGSLKIFSSLKLFSQVLLSGTILASNWFTYIWAVNTGKIIEASLGYYITPLVNIILGMIFFREKLTKLQITAVFLAAYAVIYMTFDYGKFPVAALILSFTFGFYGLLKKYFAFDSINALMAETFSILPLALVTMIFIYLKGQSYIFSGSLGTDILIMMSGIVTGVPLLFFSEGAKRIPLSGMGFLQYIGPSLMLITGIFFYKEPFLKAHKIGFPFIWLALILYSISVVKEYKKSVSD